MRSSWIAGLVSIGALACGLVAQMPAPKPRLPIAPGKFDYYVLSLSWAPGFCAAAGNAAGNPEECAVGKRIGFIVHGLWPQTILGTPPESCGTAKAVPAPVLKLILPVMFSSSLVQHEWAKHGTCTGLNVSDYFSTVLAERAAVQVPVQLTGLGAQEQQTPAQIEAEFAATNPSFTAGSFRTACTNRVLEETRVCFDKSLNPRACTPSAGECTTPSVTVLPPR